MEYGSKLTKGKDGYCCFIIKHRKKVKYFKPIDLTRIMLSYIIENTEKQYGPIHDVVISTPAYYQSTERNLIKETSSVYTTKTLCNLPNHYL